MRAGEALGLEIGNTSAMYKTLNALRSKLTPEEITLAEKAIRALDAVAVLEIIRGELYAV